MARSAPSGPPYGAGADGEGSCAVGRRVRRAFERQCAPPLDQLSLQQRGARLEGAAGAKSRATTHHRYPDVGATPRLFVPSARRCLPAAATQDLPGRREGRPGPSDVARTAGRQLQHPPPPPTADRPRSQTVDSQLYLSSGVGRRCHRECPALLVDLQPPTMSAPGAVPVSRSTPRQRVAVRSTERHCALAGRWDREFEHGCPRSLVG
jgi:hypothetical protein